MLHFTSLTGALSPHFLAEDSHARILKILSCYAKTGKHTHPSVYVRVLIPLLGLLFSQRITAPNKNCVPAMGTGLFAFWLRLEDHPTVGTCCAFIHRMTSTRHAAI